MASKPAPKPALSRKSKSKLVKADVKEHPAAPEPATESASQEVEESSRKTMTVRLPATLAKQIKVHAAIEERPIQEVFEDALESYLAKAG